MCKRKGTDTDEMGKRGKFVMRVGEHHDGFAMYASKLNRWNAANMGPKRDILRELKEAIEGHGTSHRAEHYWYFNGGRMIDSDVNDSEFEDLYGPAVYDKDLSDPFPPKNTSDKFCGS